jgi:small-conductance mechanosensitive channel
MSSGLGRSWIPLVQIEAAIRLEPALFLLAMVFGAWISYGLFLRGASPDRHKLLLRLFRNLLTHLLFAASLFMAYWLLHQVDPDSRIRRFIPPVGFVTLIWASIVFVKTCRILAFEYLFLLNMRAGVPLLLVNLLSLLLSGILGAWILSSIFEFNLAPLLATSAIFSVVLGFALQDTLGNLFAGVALQLDKPYEIGDWVEVQTSTQKFVGQVFEISWRATILTAFTDEVITVPNRVMAQAEIQNFAAKLRPFTRGHIFRLPYDAPAGKVRSTLLKGLSGVPGVRRDPSPMVLILEQTDAWVNYKLIYFIDDYGAQFRISDKVIEQALVELAKAGLKLASHRMAVLLPSGVGSNPDGADRFPIEKS